MALLCYCFLSEAADTYLVCTLAFLHSDVNTLVNRLYQQFNIDLHLCVACGSPGSGSQALTTCSVYSTPQNG